MAALGFDVFGGVDAIGALGAPGVLGAADAPDVFGAAATLAAADPTSVALTRWGGIAVVVVGVIVLVMRWWRDR